MQQPTDDSKAQGLGMTVHSLPQGLAEPAVLTPEQRRSARIKLLWLFLLCASPVIASYFTYYVIRPEGRTNYGALITPSVPMPEAVQGQTLDGQPQALSALRHQWLLVVVGGGACDAQCERHLYLARQLREGLGREKDRLDWVWFINNDQPIPDALRPALGQADVLRLPPDQLATWLKPAEGHSLSDHLYVVDPMGHWMMRFPADLAPAKARKDLERLMRASSTWDQAGRPGQ